MKTGTPLQALKFSLRLNNSMGELFLKDWLAEKDMTRWSYLLNPPRADTGSEPAMVMLFADFCKANPDPMPDWFGKFDEQVITDCMNEALGNSEGRPDGAALLRELESTGLRLVAVERERGDGRKAHYGAGRQPIDDIVDQGWGPEFCAGNIVKYLRRDKEVEDSLKKAKWYYAKLIEIVGDAPPLSYDSNVMVKLHSLLTAEEINALGEP